MGSMLSDFLQHSHVSEDSEQAGDLNSEQGALTEKFVTDLVELLQRVGIEYCDCTG